MQRTFLRWSLENYHFYKEPICQEGRVRIGTPSCGGIKTIFFWRRETHLANIMKQRTQNCNIKWNPLNIRLLSALFLPNSRVAQPCMYNKHTYSVFSAPVQSLYIHTAHIRYWTDSKFFCSVYGEMSVGNETRAVVGLRLLLPSREL